MRATTFRAGMWLGIGMAISPGALAQADRAEDDSKPVIVGKSTKNDVTRPLREIPDVPAVALPWRFIRNPSVERPRPAVASSGETDPVVQSAPFPAAMPAAALSFDGIPFPGVSCNCAPPDTNGEVGLTQYVQSVNTGFQVFDKTTGASVLGPISIAAIWTGFGGVCENDGNGDPIVLYDPLANRWLVSQFAGSPPTDECVAISTSSDATGTWYRYAFHLGSNFYDYPKLSVWPDAYYLSEDVFNAAGNAYLGAQPFALERAAMLAGNPATFIGMPLRPADFAMLPADLDGSNPPPAGAPNPWFESEGSAWSLYRFHVDWTTPANSTFTLAANLTPAAYSPFCFSFCVPQKDMTVWRLDGLGDMTMFRLAYRRFADGHEALVGNKTVSSGGVAGLRWFEISNATSGTPAFVQQSTYQPDATYRWMGSAAMDRDGNLAVGFSASSSSIFPEIRYAGRLAGDPPGVLAQGEATLHAGTGSQDGTDGRWGDYSALSVDPVNDCTFWFTSEYYASTSAFNWRTRIGSFTFPCCNSTAVLPPITPSPSPVCASSAGNQASGPAGASSYVWTISNGTITAGTGTQTVTYTAGASGNVTLGLTVTNASGCPSGAASLQVPIVFSPTSFTGRAFQDLDASGSDNGGTDPGLGGVTVSLYRDTNTSGTLDGGDTLVSSTTTAAGTGIFTLSTTGSGTYFVSQTLPAGYVQTMPVAPAPYTLAVSCSGGSYATLDFGNAKIANLVMSKSAPGSVTAGSTLTFLLTSTNTGPVAAPDVTITDVVPAGTRFVSATPSPGGVLTVSPPAGGTGTVTASWTGDTAVGVSRTLTLVVSVCADLACSSSIANTASTASPAVDPSTGNNSASSSTTVQAQADLRLTAAAAPSTVGAGGQVSYTLTATNAGPSSDPGVTVSQTLPAGFTVVSATPTQGSCSGAGTGAVSCTLGGLAAPGACTPGPTSATITVVAQVDLDQPAGAYASVATIAGTACNGDPAPSSNTVSVTTQVAILADLALAKVDTPDPVASNREISYTLTVTNLGPSRAFSVKVVDSLPSSVRFRSVRAPAGWTCSTPYAGPAGGVVSCQAPQGLAPGSYAIGISVLSPTICSRQVTVVNTAVVTSASTDPSPGNNSASAATLVVGTACF